MALASYSVKAPGSMMLFGEHAVLHGKQAIVAAINKYIKVQLTPRIDNRIEIISKEFGKYQTSINKFKTTKKYNFVLESIKQNIKKIKSGFSLQISSDFTSSVGFGSSAAVTAATLSVLDLWLNKKIDPMKTYKKGLKIIRSVQSTGSGADIGASVFGGVIAYKMKSISIKKIADSIPLVAVYSGSKFKTNDAIKKVERNRKKFPKIYSEIYHSMDLCSKKAINAIKKRDWKKLGELMNIHQGLQDAIGVNNDILSELIFSLRSIKHSSFPHVEPSSFPHVEPSSFPHVEPSSFPHVEPSSFPHVEPSSFPHASSGNLVYGAKISGSGLGDCVIGLGKIKQNLFPKNKTQEKIGVKQFDISVSKKGVHVVG